LESIEPTGEVEQSHLQIAIAVHKAANEILSKAQEERKKEWWIHNIEPLIENKKRAYKMLDDQNAEDRDWYKRANTIMKERVKERRNRMWKVKYREVNNMVGSQIVNPRLTEVSMFFKEFAEWFPIFWAAFNYNEGVITSLWISSYWE